AFLRVVYAFMVPIYGGRRWTLFSTAILLIPLLWMIRVLAADQTPFWVLTVIALLSGLGGAVR
ncbi:nitrate/nitrite transporter, partial [Candidatus Entotheonella serta]